MGLSVCANVFSRLKLLIMTFRDSTEWNCSPRTVTLRVWTSVFCTSGACGRKTQHQDEGEGPNRTFMKASQDLKVCTLVEFCV